MGDFGAVSAAAAPAWAQAAFASSPTDVEKLLASAEALPLHFCNVITLLRHNVSVSCQSDSKWTLPGTKTP